MRVMITGSRSWTDQEAIARALRFLARCHGTNVTVMHGGARGADRLAAKAAIELGLHIEVWPADWTVTPDTPPERIRRRPRGGAYDAAAGVLRNGRMLDAGPDLVLAFHRNESTGTQDAIDGARRRGIPVVLYRWTEDPWPRETEEAIAA